MTLTHVQFDAIVLLIAIGFFCAGKLHERLRHQKERDSAFRNMSRLMPTPRQEVPLKEWASNYYCDKTGLALDDFAAKCLITRRFGETDDELRIRLRAELMKPGGIYS